MYTLSTDKKPLFPFSIEPIGSVAPKITSGDDFKRLKCAQNHSISFLCPAQSSPLGIYR